MVDYLTPKQRSDAMRKVRSKNTSIEVLLCSLLQKRGLRFRKHYSRLPGKPDIVFVARRLAVFVNGDFWHGYRCREWLEKLSPVWQQKIMRNRERDSKHYRKLVYLGWRVIKVWQHQLKRDSDAVVDRIVTALAKRPDFGPIGSGVGSNAISRRSFDRPSENRLKEEATATKRKSGSATRKKTKRKNT